MRVWTTNGQKLQLQAACACMHGSIVTGRNACSADHGPLHVCPSPPSLASVAQAGCRKPHMQGEAMMRHARTHVPHMRVSRSRKFMGAAGASPGSKRNAYSSWVLQAPRLAANASHNAEWNACTNGRCMQRRPGCWQASPLLRCMHHAGTA